MQQEENIVAPEGYFFRVKQRNEYTNYPLVVHLMKKVTKKGWFRTTETAISVRSDICNATSHDVRHTMKELLYLHSTASSRKMKRDALIGDYPPKVI